MNEASLPEYLQDKEWHSLLEELPDGWEAAEEEQKAIQRLRKITSPGDLLRLVLIYATTLSLRLTALWAAALSIAEMSHQAVAQRLLSASLWLSFLLGELMNERVSWPEALPQKQVTVVLLDATALARSKSPGVEWRIHLHFSPWHQTPLRMTLTDVHGGEHVRQLGVATGDIVVGDRAFLVKCLFLDKLSEAKEDTAFGPIQNSSWILLQFRFSVSRGTTFRCKQQKVSHLILSPGCVLYPAQEASKKFRLSHGMTKTIAPCA